MTALDECHARGFIHKVLGNCNDIKTEVNKCLSAARYDQAKNNRDTARNKRQRIEEIWARERALEQPAQSPCAENSGAAKQ